MNNQERAMFKHAIKGSNDSDFKIFLLDILQHKDWHSKDVIQNTNNICIRLSWK
jgi:hypothetical protein